MRPAAPCWPRWIAILLLTLPGRYTSSDWRAVWVGLDIAELLGFAATAWAAWHQRQVVITFMNVTGTLLLCDAWFDLTLNYGSSGFTASISPPSWPSSRSRSRCSPGPGGWSGLPSRP